MNIDKEKIINHVIIELEKLGYAQNDIRFMGVTGSALFKGIEKANDIDILIIVDNFKDKDVCIPGLTINDKPYDFFFEDSKLYQDRLDFKVITGRSIYNIFWKFTEVIYGENDFHFDPFKHKEEYKELIKERIYNHGFNPKSTILEPRWKKLATPLLFFQVLSQGEYKITEEMKERINKLYNHDIYIAAKIGWNVGLKLNRRIWQNHFRNIKGGDK